MTPLAEQLVARAHEASERLGCGTGDETLVADGDLGHLEHLIHELSHAVALDLPVEGPYLGDKIDQAIRALSDHVVTHADEDAPHTLSTQCEAVAWAIEVAVWRLLELPMTEADAYDHAEVQGVESEQLEKWLQQDWSWQADTVLAHLRRLCFEVDNNCPSGNMAKPA